MKDIKTSYSEKKDKSRGKIVFEQFPGDVKKKNIQISLKKSKKILGLIFLVIILLVLFVGSSFLNKKLLDEKDNKNYKLVNKFEEKYANIKPDKRSVLFKNVGFKSNLPTIIQINIVITLGAIFARFPGKLVNIGSINKITPSKTIAKPV